MLYRVSWADSGEFVCEETISIIPILTSYRIQDRHIMDWDVAHTEYQLNICCPQIVYPDAPDIAAKINQSIEKESRGEEYFSILFWGMLNKYIV